MCAPAVARPYPWDSLEVTSRAAVEALCLVRRWAHARTDLSRLPLVLSSLLETNVTVAVRRAGIVEAAAGLEGGAGVLLASADEPGLGRSALVQAEGALVSAVLRRIAARNTALALDPPEPLHAAAVGAFAALVTAAVRRSKASAAIRVLSAGPASALEADLVGSGEALVSVTLTVIIEDDAFDARVVVPRRAADAAPALPWDAEALAKLGPTPLALPVVACVFRASVLEVAQLGVGDVVVPSTWGLAREGGALRGPVWLAAPAADHGVRADLVDGGRLVLAGMLEPLGPADAPEANMVDEGVDKAALIDAIGEVPVLVRVEIGEAHMPARAWAAVGKGDVVTLGRRVGESVILRIAGVPVARGDLVEIEGEVGVRIVERLTGEGSEP